MRLQEVSDKMNQPEFARLAKAHLLCAQGIVAEGFEAGGHKFRRESDKLYHLEAQKAPEDAILRTESPFQLLERVKRVSPQTSSFLSIFLMK